MEPQRVIERGHLHVGLVIADPVRKGCSAKQVEVTGVGQQRPMQFRRIAHTLGQAEPDVLERRPFGRIEFIARIDMPELERPLP